MRLTSMDNTTDVTTYVIQTLAECLLQLMQTYDIVIVLLAIFGAAALVRAVLETGSKVFVFLIQICVITPILIVITISDLKNPSKRQEIIDIIKFVKQNPLRFVVAILWLLAVIAIFSILIYTQF